MAIKWGSTLVTAVKWGSTNCTQVKWGSTIVFPNSTGYNGSTFADPIASGFNTGMSFHLNFRESNVNTTYMATTSNDNINFTPYSRLYITSSYTTDGTGAWATLYSVSCSGSQVWATTGATADINISSVTSTGKLYIRIYFQYDGSGYPRINVDFKINSIVFS